MILILIPSVSICWMTGTASTVPGILTIRFGRSTADQSRRASAVVTAGSRAARGETSIETKPSPPSDDS